MRSLFECSISTRISTPSPLPSPPQPFERNFTTCRSMRMSTLQRNEGIELTSLSVLVFKHGKIVARGVDGAERDSRYHLGSCTKAMTAMLCARFKEKGRLSFDDPITKYFKTSNSSLWYDVTIRHLMSHESGLDQTINSKTIWSYMWRETNRKDQRPIRKHVCETLLNTVDPSKGKKMYVVFEREARESLTFCRTFMFQLRLCMTRIAHSYSKNKSRKNINARIQLIMMIY